MRVNPLVCIEVDEMVSSRQWTSVIVFGSYEELPDTPEWANEREFAHKMLQVNEVWWEPGYASSILHAAERRPVPVYRIEVVQITGHRTNLDPVASPDTRLTTPSLSDYGWLQTFLRQIRDKSKIILKQRNQHTLEILAAVSILREHLPDLKIQVIHARCQFLPCNASPPLPWSAIEAVLVFPRPPRYLRPPPNSMNKSMISRMRPIPPKPYP